MLRRRVIAGAVALFAATWLLILVTLASGHDPALARKSAAVVRTATTATSSTTTTTPTTTTPTTTTPTTATITTPSTTTSTTTTTAQRTPTAVTTRQS